MTMGRPNWSKLKGGFFEVRTKTISFLSMTTCPDRHVLKFTIHLG